MGGARYDYDALTYGWFDIFLKALVAAPNGDGSVPADLRPEPMVDVA